MTTMRAMRIMRAVTIVLALGAAAWATTGCGGDEAPEPAPAPAPAGDAADGETKRERTSIYGRALDKAEAVEDAAAQRERELQKAIGE